MINHLFVEWLTQDTCSINLIRLRYNNNYIFYIFFYISIFSKTEPLIYHIQVQLSFVKCLDSKTPSCVSFSLTRISQCRTHRLQWYKALQGHNFRDSLAILEGLPSK